MDAVEDVVAVTEQCGDVGRHHVVKIAQAVEVDIQNGDIGAQARGHLGGIGSHDAATQHHDVGRQHARHSPQKDAPAFKRALLGSPGSLVAFQLGPEDAKVIRPLLALKPNRDLYDALTDLPPYHAYGRSAGRAQLLTMPPLSEETNVAKRIRRHCRTKYGRRRDQVERDIEAFISERMG